MKGKIVHILVTAKNDDLHQTIGLEKRERVHRGSLMCTWETQQYSVVSLPLQRVLPRWASQLPPSSPWSHLPSQVRLTLHLNLRAFSWQSSVCSATVPALNHLHGQQRVPQLRKRVRAEGNYACIQAAIFKWIHIRRNEGVHPIMNRNNSSGENYKITLNRELYSCRGRSVSMFY
jgi:hypothetical protein